MDKEAHSWRWLLVTGAVYVGLAASPFTGVYDYIGAGNDLSWLGIVAFFAAPLALALSWPLPAALGVTALGAAISFAIVAHSDDPLEVFGVIFFSAIALLVLCVGRLATAGLRRGGLSRWGETRTATVLLAIAVIPFGISLQRLATWTKVPSAEARSLPIDDVYLSDLCNDGPRARLEAEGRALVKSTLTHPGWVVRITETDDDGTTYSHETVRQLAKDQLDDLKRWHCEPALQAELARAIGR